MGYKDKITPGEKALAGAGNGIWYGHNVNVAGIPQSGSPLQPDWGIPAASGKLFPNEKVVGKHPVVHNIVIKEVVGGHLAVCHAGNKEVDKRALEESMKNALQSMHKQIGLLHGNGQKTQGTKLNPEEVSKIKQYIDGRSSLQAMSINSYLPKPDFERANKYTLGFEGGFVNDISDPGGATDKGITFNNFKKWANPDLGIAPSMENLRALTISQASVLYKKHYWDKINGDQFKDGNVAFAIYDFSVNSGKGVWEFEKAFNKAFGGITVDGKLSKDDIAKINSVDGKEVFKLRHLYHLTRG